MYINNIQIHNFRSIIHFDGEMGPLNIFVGQNDEGKSNVIRALDLFFNHNSPDGYPFKWEYDYCYFAKPRLRKADEISVALTISPPVTFKHAAPVKWKKVWRRDGLYKDEINHVDGTEVEPRSKIPGFLRNIRFDYVPAIKGAEYFSGLMSKVHDMLEATVEQEVRDASKGFTDRINDNTSDILRDIEKQLGLTSTIQLPPDLRTLFGQLQFTSTTGEKLFALDQRGDGVKVRHIPIVLKWLAQQASDLSVQGKPKSVTIWGYEEPENSLEIRRCFDLALDLVEGNTDIQAFVTTHSPAFYSICRQSGSEKTRLFLVEKDNNPPVSEITPITPDDVSEIDSAMGLMNLLEPHFKDARLRIRELENTIKELPDTSKPTIFVEGPSDVTLLGKALESFFPSCKDQIRIKTHCGNGGGYGYVQDSIIAWSYSRPTANAVGLFDADPDAVRAMNEARKTKNSNGRAFCLKLDKNDTLIECFRSGFKVPFAIEELLPEDIWEHAEAKGWLEQRPNLLSLYPFDRTDVSFNEHLASNVENEHLRRIICKKVSLRFKKQFACYAAGKIEERESDSYVGLKTNLLACFEKLDLTP